eukprot:CAMPEP_0194506702 /NCGR_PEP_ID=MMETSP0253-20130528/35130_1 /TAXON_ID=2966 /ORGANISM="Noctiluca scintillans" /LENGTH=121 /DNA_ID=CAMNT_0039349469 /DNA_START=380 /DNA_END=741 /DNA_ORIENTATION=-
MILFEPDKVFLRTEKSFPTWFPLFLHEIEHHVRLVDPVSTGRDIDGSKELQTGLILLTLAEAPEVHTLLFQGNVWRNHVQQWKCERECTRLLAPLDNRRLDAGTHIYQQQAHAGKQFVLES